MNEITKITNRLIHELNIMRVSKEDKIFALINTLLKLYGIQNKKKFYQLYEILKEKDEK